MKKKTKSYQLTCLFSPLGGKEEAEKNIKQIQEWIVEQEGSIPKKETSDVVRKGLAYPVKKCQEAFYWNTRFLLPPKQVRKLRRKLEAEDNIIRCMIIEKKKTKVQPIKETAKEVLDLKIVDKIEPLTNQPVKPKDDQVTPEKETHENPIVQEKKAAFPTEEEITKETDDFIASQDTTPKHNPDEKVQIEELDKKLEEILNQ